MSATRHPSRVGFPNVLQAAAAALPDHTAVVCGTDRLTYGQLAARVRALAAALVHAGVGPGDRVVWAGQNCHRMLELLLAAAHLGAVACPVNWRWSAEELAFALDDAGPAVVLWQNAEIGSTVRAARARTAGATRWIQHDTDGPDGYEAILREGATSDPTIEHGSEPGDAVLMLYTAAFDGRPNAAMLTEHGLLHQASVMAMLEEASSSYTYLNCGPLFHIATVVMMLATFTVSGTNVFVPRVDAETLCRVVERERCTGAYILGPTAREIVALVATGGHDLSSLRVRTGDPAFDALTSPVTTRWSARPGGYGQTECGGLLTYRPIGPPPLGRHGRPGPGVAVRVVDADGSDVPTGEVGEIVARAPGVMRGYWNRPDLSEARRAGGWHHTSDLGRLERDGSLTFVGPMARMIKSASENVYPAEVEACIAAHPGVAEVAVIGIPDPVWHQSVRAIVVPAPGVTLTESDVIAHCRAHLASYKKPRSVVFADALPRHAGRIDYTRLDAAHGGGAYPGTDQAGMTVPPSTHST